VIDRLVFVGLFRLFRNVRDALAIVKPETIVRWHRAGSYWRWKSPPRGDRPTVPLEIRRLIREMSIVSHAVAVLRMPVNKFRCQIILPTTVAISAAEKARNDSVRTLPSAPRLKLSDIAEDSSGASTIVTMS